MGHMEGGGPYLWRKHLVDSCPFNDGGARTVADELDPNGELNKEELMEKYKKTCLNPSHQHPDDNKPTWKCDDMCLEGSENGRFVKESMLSLDMGLYYDFKTDNVTSRVEGFGVDGSLSCPGKSSWIIIVFSLQTSGNIFLLDIFQVW